MILPNLPDKRYFTIGETSDVLDIKPHMLRYWEQEFPVLRPRKTPKGHRLYTRKNLEVILRIRELLYTEKFTIEGAKKKLNSEFRGESVSLLDRRYQTEKLKMVKTELKKILDMLIDMENNDKKSLDTEGEAK